MAGERGYGAAAACAVGHAVHVAFAQSDRDTVAAAITAGMTASQFVDLDLAYAPAVSPMWDAFALAARSTLG